MKKLILLFIVLIPLISFCQTTFKKGIIVVNGADVDTIWADIAYLDTISYDVTLRDTSSYTIGKLIIDTISQRMLEDVFTGQSKYDNFPNPWYPYTSEQYAGARHKEYLGYTFDDQVDDSRPDTTYSFSTINPIPAPRLTGKDGGLFLRTDDPFLQGVYPPGLDLEYSYFATLIDITNKYQVKATFAVICQYPNHAGIDTVCSVLWPDNRRNNLRMAAEMGHTFASHSVNHSMNYYQTPYDDLSEDDSILLADGYTMAGDGVDTIIINNSNQTLIINHWAHFPDDHFASFGYYRLYDHDNDMDSIWMKRKIMANSVYISLYPNRYGIKKMLDEAQRRFRRNGMPRFDFFIHPGQTEHAGYDLDTVYEGSGYIIPVVGKDSVYYYVEDTLSSLWFPTAPNTGDRKMTISGTDYWINKVDSIDETTYKCKLQGYTGAGGQVNDVKLKPNVKQDWDVYIHPDSLDLVAYKSGLYGAAVYPYGRQYEATGYNGGSINRDRFRYGHQMKQFYYFYVPHSADSIIEIICRHAARHTFAHGNDHAGYRDWEQRDSVYSFVFGNQDKIKFLSNRDMIKSVYLTAQNPYENILVEFSRDLNSDGLSDGWDIDGATKSTGLDQNGDTWSYLVDATDSIYCNDLWGVEKGINQFIIYARDADSDAVSLDICVKEYYSKQEEDGGATANGVTNYSIAGLSVGWTNGTVDISIKTTTDWIDISISATGGDIEIIAPKMKLKY